MIRVVGIIAKPQQQTIRAVVPPLLAWLRERRLEVFCDQETAACLEEAPGAFALRAAAPVKPDLPLEFSGYDVLRVAARAELPAMADLLLVLGGDGTLLAAVRAMGEREVPILPVNLGGLGFLTSVKLDEVYPILELVLAGRHRISERIMLQADVIRGGKVTEQHRALNDAVLNKTTLARITDFHLHIDGGYASSYRADGIIISTPTGSTAYSLSAGGPIVYPVVEAFLITPICPHSLTNRPLVIPDTSRIEVEFRAGEQSVYLTVDGQVGVELFPGDRIGVNKAPTKLKLVRPPEKTYFEILRSKFKWGER